jgi:hypothetical protein
MPATERQLDEITGLRDEALHETDEGRIQRIADELVSRADEAASMPEDRLLAAIEREYLQNPLQYRNTLDVCEGSERAAARLCLDHMVKLLEHGKPWPMVKSMAHLDGFCRVVTMGPRAVRGCIDDLKRRGAELRAAGLRPTSLRE